MWSNMVKRVVFSENLPLFLCDSDGNIPAKMDAPSGKTFSFPKLMNSLIQIRAMVLVYSSIYRPLV